MPPMHYTRELSFFHTRKLCVLNTPSRVKWTSSVKSKHFEKIPSSISFLKNHGTQSEAAPTPSENGNGVIVFHRKLAILRSDLLFSVHLLQFGCWFKDFHGSVAVSLHSQNKFSQDDQQPSRLSWNYQCRVTVDASLWTCDAQANTG